MFWYTKIIISLLYKHFSKHWELEGGISWQYLLQEVHVYILCHLTLRVFFRLTSEVLGTAKKPCTTRLRADNHLCSCKCSSNTNMATVLVSANTLQSASWKCEHYKNTHCIKSYWTIQPIIQHFIHTFKKQMLNIPVTKLHVWILKKLSNKSNRGQVFLNVNRSVRFYRHYASIYFSENLP